MQNAKDKARRGKKENKPEHTKRSMLILAVIVLVLVLLLGKGLWALIPMFGNGNTRTDGENADLESYLSDKWTVFQLRSWDPESGVMELDYPLRFTYAQMEKYGGSLEEINGLPTGNLSTAALLKTAAYEDLGAVISEVTVYGRTTDGQIAYTVSPDGSISACWDSQ